MIQRQARILAKQIADYPKGEIAAPTENHVLRWVEQFDASARRTVLREMSWLLERYYVTRQHLEAHLDRILFFPELAETDSRIDWRRVAFLDLQPRGKSQNTLLGLLEARLRQRFGVSLNACGADPHHYVYLDDCIYTGRTFSHDLERWLPQAVAGATVHLIVFGLHTEGREYHERRLAPLLEKYKVKLAVSTVHTHVRLSGSGRQLKCSGNKRAVAWGLLAHCS
jgi:hypothetical protein